MLFAIAEDMRKDDPTTGTTAPKATTNGWNSWGEEQINKFETHHPMGTRPRLALALLLYTAQRKGDVIRMGRQHVHGDLIEVQQN